MSSEDRLARLGLSHLKDDPAALQKALQDGIDAHKAKVAAWRKEQERKIAAGEILAPDDEEEMRPLEAADDDSENTLTKQKEEKRKALITRMPKTNSGVISQKIPSKKL